MLLGRCLQGPDLPVPGRILCRLDGDLHQQRRVPRSRSEEVHLHLPSLRKTMNERLPAIDQLYFVEVHGEKPVLPEGGETALVLRDHPTDFHGGNADKPLIFQVQEEVRIEDQISVIILL